MLRFLIGLVFNTKLVRGLLMVPAIPAFISYYIFLIIRWHYRLFSNGCIMIIGGTLLAVGGAYLLLSPPQALSMFTLILLLHGVWFSRKGELFIVWWRAQWRYWTKYRWEFPVAIRSANLVSMDPKHPGVRARIQHVTANEFVDLVEIRMSPHQTPELYQQEVKGIRQTLGAVGGRAVQSRKSVQNVTLWLWKTDPLNQIVRPYEHRLPPADDDWDAWFKQGLEIGRYEDGSPFKIDLISTPFHWLFAGPSRSGKSGAIGSVLGAGEWALHKKAWLIDAIDPARGVELTMYNEAKLFNKFVCGKLPDKLQGLTLEKLYEEYGDDWIELLGPQFKKDVARTIHQFYGEMCLRAAEILGKARHFTPSVKTPLRHLLIDEIATIMAMGTIEVDGVKVNITLELEEILRQGAKFGFLVLGAVQDPLKDQVKVRDLFTYFSVFGDVGMVGFDKLFGSGSYKAAGSPAIPMRLQGVSITGTNVLSLEEIAKLASEFDKTIRIRFSWETDADIAAMGERGRKAREPDPTTNGEVPAREAALV